MASTLLITELEGASPLALSLSGGIAVKVGATFGVASKGGKYTPIGSRESLLSVTAVDFSDTEMELSFYGQYLGGVRSWTIVNRPSSGESEGLTTSAVGGLTPEGIFGALHALVVRGRECNVELAGFQRRGVLREATPTPGKGYSVDPATGQMADVPGVSLEVKLRWEWAGVGQPTTSSSSTTVSGASLSGSLSMSSSGLASALAACHDFSPGLLEKITDGIGNVRNSIQTLRNNIKNVGNLITAPARVANLALASARTLGSAIHDVDVLVSTTATEYRSIPGNFSALVRAGTQMRSVRTAVNNTTDDLVAVFEAIEKRKKRTVGVHPGESLVAVAAIELGDPKRWPDIAFANGWGGQTVPPGQFTADIPPQ